MDPREPHKDEGMAADTAVPGSSAAEKTDYIDSRAIYHEYRWYWAGRRTQDIILSLIALLVLWPIMLLQLTTL